MDYIVNYEFEKLSIVNKKIHLIFNINITYIEDKKLDSKQLEKEVNLFLGNDKKYITIFKCNNKKVELEFNIDKWFKENISTGIVDTPDSFEKKIKLNKLPILITRNIDVYNLSSYMEQSFRNYLNNNNKLKKMICSSVKTAIKDLSLSFFKFEYDGYFNCINISLKPEFRIRPEFFVKPIEKPKKINFDKTVYSKLNRKNK